VWDGVQQLSLENMVQNLQVLEIRNCLINWVASGRVIYSSELVCRPTCIYAFLEMNIYHTTFKQMHNTSPPYPNLSIPLLSRNMGQDDSPRLRVIPAWSVSTAVFSYSLVNHHIRINADLRHVMCNKFKNNSIPDLATHDSATICKIICSFHFSTIANTYIWI
jgi:hypothetical protein